jgi:hypothetical protein
MATEIISFEIEIDLKSFPCSRLEWVFGCNIFFGKLKSVCVCVSECVSRSAQCMLELFIFFVVIIVVG